MTAESPSQAAENYDYNPIMTVLALRPRLLRLLLPLLILAFTAVSGSAFAGPKPASGQFLTAATLIGAETLQDATLHQAVWKISPKPAAGCCVAADSVGDYLAGSGGRLGGAATRGLNNDIATNLEDLGYDVTNGAGRGPEEFIPGPGGGVSGSTNVDITATDGTSTIRVQTIDTLADGITPTSREAAAAARIQLNFPNDQLLLVPK